ncbi:MAG: response regulator, partial [Cytophagaceae bacterium]
RLSLIRKINQIYLLTWCILVAEIGAFLFTENGALLFSDYTLKMEDEIPEKIYLDLNMPHMNGYEFLDIFNQLPIHWKVKIIIVTSSNATEDIEKSAEYKNVINYMVKPVHKDDIIRKRIRNTGS